MNMIKKERKHEYQYIMKPFTNKTINIIKRF